ncbi:MAG: stage II sporulation protein M [Firmicutes bacterium]|nr:stage II sporulation protein M [Bacillota bacterium]
MGFAAFIREHKEDWSSLEDLLSRFHKQKHTISAQDIDLLTRLYRRSSTHLAYLRTYYPEDSATSYLNDLVTRAHHIVYREEYTSGHQLSHFFKSYFPSLIQKRGLFIGFAFLLFLVGALSGFLAIYYDPLNLYVVLPPEIAEGVSPDRLGEGHEFISHPVISAAIMTNNIRVAILAFVGGVTFGTFSFYLLLDNGLMLGALAAVFWRAGKLYPFFAYILPHGIIELTAIFIAGGAGLYMGYHMLVPGPYPWKHQFLRSARESAQLLLGTFPLFVIAAVIEGYITPSSLTLGAKYSVAAVTLILLAAYYRYGRFQERQSASLDLTSR